MPNNFIKISTLPHSSLAAYLGTAEEGRYRLNGLGSDNNLTDILSASRFAIRNDELSDETIRITMVPNVNTFTFGHIINFSGQGETKLLVSENNAPSYYSTFVSSPFKMDFYKTADKIKTALLSPIIIGPNQKINSNSKIISAITIDNQQIASFECNLKALKTLLLTNNPMMSYILIGECEELSRVKISDSPISGTLSLGKFGNTADITVTDHNLMYINITGNGNTVINQNNTNISLGTLSDISFIDCIVSEEYKQILQEANIKVFDIKTA